MKKLENSLIELQRQQQLFFAERDMILIKSFKGAMISAMSGELQDMENNLMISISMTGGSVPPHL